MTSHRPKNHGSSGRGGSGRGGSGHGGSGRGVPGGVPGADGPGSQTPVPIRPCDLFSEDIHLLVDGELGVAETALVEEHLQSCSRCLAIAARLEAMSSLLKDWDARTNDIPVPGLRIKHGVLTRVKEHSARRRRESRVVGLLQYATAALVLVAIGLGASLGARSSFTQSVTSSVTSSVPSLDGVSPDGVSSEGVRLAGLATRETSAELAGWSSVPSGGASQGPLAPQLAPLAASANEPDWDRLGEWREVWADGSGHRRVAFLYERLRRQEALAERLDTPVTFWPGPRIDAPGQRLLTISALNFLHDQGHLETWKLALQASDEASSPTAEVSPQPVATDMTAAQMLSPMPGVDRALGLLYKPGFLTATALPRADTRKGAPSSASSASANPSSAGQPPEYLLQAWPLPIGADGKGLLALGLTGLSPGGASRGASHRRRFMDPLKAEANNKLRLREEADGEGSVVFIVEDTREPIYIPAGQFIDGGLGARVVSEPVWLPPSKGKTPHIVSCRMISGGVLSERMAADAARGPGRGHPTLVPYIAGPTIRALLAAAATQAQVRKAAQRIFALRYPGNALADPFGAWSLLDVYGGQTGERYHALFSGRLDWKKGRGGFVVRDATGRLVGIESIRFRGPAAEELLLRLWVGYLVEAVLRVSSDQARSDLALASPGDEVTQAFHRIANHAALFRMPIGFDPSQGWCVSSLEIVAAGLHLHALQVGGQPMVVSVVAGLQPTR